MPDQPPDWPDVQKSARRVSVRPRVVKIALPPRNRENIRELTDRLPRTSAENVLPRPGKVDLVAAPKAKQGNEISGEQMAAMKAGAVKIDARLDLHGMTQREAHAELMRFMEKQAARGSRMLLIITGKGREMQGVLRAALPGWLMAGAFKRYILTIHPAHARHGGDGATYVLLRRQVEQ